MGSNSYVWIGNQEKYLDQPFVLEIQHKVVFGAYGGNSSAGASKNEDAALCWSAEDGNWELTAILDAHNSSESAELVIQELQDRQPRLTACLGLPEAEAFQQLQNEIIGMLTEENFKLKCRAVKGETSFLVCARKGSFLWWFTIGDCSLYLFHEELAARGQYALIQRQYYEWIGNQSAFHSAVPCYSTGIRELREGRNLIFLATDGLLEFGEHVYEHSAALYEKVTTPDGTLSQRILALLEDVHQGKGQDSATILSWVVESTNSGCYPSDEVRRIE
ncbi:protein phosphatase 2C domain-containing protein [Paenibacillus gansuensis]|uniref:Protein phosphatase 2C domain-containing protein n=1 Tax=Paenibacillus gansuensis TaxID=306542 RepID=A0ABW5PJ00_9BACL